MSSEGSNQPIRLLVANGRTDDATARTAADADAAGHPKSRFAVVAFLTATALSALWAGGVGGYLMGMFGPDGLAGLDLRQWAILTVATAVPPLLFMAVAWTMIRGQAMADAADAFADAAKELFAADETASRTAERIGRAVRRELDALNAGLDTAFSRMHALQDQVEGQIAAIDAAGARIDARGDTLANRLSNERSVLEAAAVSLNETAAQTGETLVKRMAEERGTLEAASAALTDAAGRAGEIVAGRAAQLKETISAAGNVLTTAGETLETQTTRFREAAASVAEVPQAAATELDKQIKRIETVAETAMSRAEFVLGRQERHRAAMNEMLGKLKEESAAFDAAIQAERKTMDEMLGKLNIETKRFGAVSSESERRIDAIMAAAATHTGELAQTFAREAKGLKETGDAAAQTLGNMIGELQQAGAKAQALIAESAGKTKAQAETLVGGAMGECGKLLRTADRLAHETAGLRESLNQAVSEVQQHLTLLPDLAKEEAQKIRATVAEETEEMLDQSARTMAALHARRTREPVLKLDRALPPEESAGLDLLKRRIGVPRTAPAAAAGPRREKVRDERNGAKTDGKSWEMRSLLEAVDGDGYGGAHAAASGKARAHKPSPASALQMLEETLSDMAVDLDAISGGAKGNEETQIEEWRRYLAGDRGVFARKLAAAIDGETVHRIAMLYRENAAFRDSANAYLEEFELLLTEVRDGVGGSLLATTFLSADTGKIYLAISYALGRL